MRGYACVGLHMPKNTVNIGSTLRAAHVYGVSLVVTSGRRYHPVASDTTKAFRTIPFLQADDVFDALPYDCVPVAVDIVPDAISLPHYVHPERAFYIFGPEDGTLGARILNRCRDRIMIPTRYCMNLAAAVNVVLYDRLCKADTVLPLPLAPEPFNAMRRLERERYLEQAKLALETAEKVA